MQRLNKTFKPKIGTVKIEQQIAQKIVAVKTKKDEYKLLVNFERRFSESFYNYRFYFLEFSRKNFNKLVAPKLLHCKRRSAKVDKY